MSTISQYAFTNAFKADKITERQAREIGVQSYVITVADTDNNGELSFEEIISNTELCDEILQQINSTKATVSASPKEEQVNTDDANISYKA